MFYLLFRHVLAPLAPLREKTRCKKMKPRTSSRLCVLFCWRALLQDEETWREGALNALLRILRYDLHTHPISSCLNAVGGFGATCSPLASSKR